MTAVTIPDHVLEEAAAALVEQTSDFADRMSIPADVWDEAMDDARILLAALTPHVTRAALRHAATVLRHEGAMHRGLAGDAIRRKTYRTVVNRLEGWAGNTLPPIPAPDPTEVTP